jgi:diaminohydroxyphosphoribosylaminopyrimidine deaminase/5-amino-6-(5-phosphoribosylamino)uracil reductase
MREAIKAAKKGKNKVYPNPMVGCVIVKDNKIISKGFHEYFGGNHAEINALTEAGDKAKGADLYVTLEPCNSYGKRPPCTQSIIKAGISQVFFAVKDPNVSKSKEVLEKSGVKVYCGILSGEAKILLKDYLKHLKIKPKVSIKAAMSLDGKIAAHTYDSKWITSDKARDFTHKLRSVYDAVLVGTNTALKDNPSLTSHGKGRNPVRVVIDFNLKISENYHIVDSSAATVIIYDEKLKNIPRCLFKKNIIFAPVNAEAARKDFKVIVEKLKSFGLRTVLIEGGGEIISSALFSAAVDDIFLFVAPKIIGGKNAPSVVGGIGVKKVSEALKFKNIKIMKIGTDFLFTGQIVR